MARGSCDGCHRLFGFAEAIVVTRIDDGELSAEQAVSDSPTAGEANVRGRYHRYCYEQMHAQDRAKWPSPREISLG